MSMHDAWYLEPQPTQDAWSAIESRRAAEVIAPQSDAWSQIEMRRAVETAPAAGGGFVIKPVHFAIGGLLLLAVILIVNGKGR